MKQNQDNLVALYYSLLGKHRDHRAAQIEKFLFSTNQDADSIDPSKNLPLIYTALEGKDNHTVLALLKHGAKADILIDSSLLEHYRKDCTTLKHTLSNVEKYISNNSNAYDVYIKYSVTPPKKIDNDIALEELESWFAVARLVDKIFTLQPVSDKDLFFNLWNNQTLKDVFVARLIHWCHNNEMLINNEGSIEVIYDLPKFIDHLAESYNHINVVSNLLSTTKKQVEDFDFIETSLKCQLEGINPTPLYLLNKYQTSPQPTDIVYKRNPEYETTGVYFNHLLRKDIAKIEALLFRDAEYSKCILNAIQESTFLKHFSLCSDLVNFIQITHRTNNSLLGNQFSATNEDLE